MYTIEEVLERCEPKGTPITVRDNVTDETRVFYVGQRVTRTPYSPELPVLEGIVVCDKYARAGCQDANGLFKYIPVRDLNEEKYGDIDEWDEAEVEDEDGGFIFDFHLWRAKDLVAVEDVGVDVFKDEEYQGAFI